MKLVSLNIDGHNIQVPSGTTVLEAAQSTDISIPTLCHFPDLTPSGFCRVCVVEVDGHENLLPACTLQAKDGMVVKTLSQKVVTSRRMAVEMLTAQHPLQCLTCYRSGKCTLQELATQYGIQQPRFFRRASGDNESSSHQRFPLDDKSPAIVHDPNMCILCGLCIETCRTMQAVDVIDFAGRGHERIVECAFGQSLDDVECIACGQCIQICPTQSYYERSEILSVQEALENPSLHVVGILSPMVGASIGEEFEQGVGFPLHQQLVAILKTIGFDRIFDTSVGADILLLEESYELLTRLKAKKRLPMISSSSPALVKYMEHFYPEHLPLLSSCKSPAQSLAALVKTYYAKKEKIPPDQIFTVSITPCTAEKFERTRSEMRLGGYQTIDACLTTKEIAGFLKQKTGDMILSIPPQPYDPPFDNASGAGTIWGAAGGMIEGVMRTFYELLTRKKLSSPEFENLREPKKFQDVTLKLEEQALHAAIIHSTGEIPQLMENIISGAKQYHYIEVKSCLLGCARGGGAPLPCITENVLARSRTLYEIDATKEIRKAHENPLIKQIYEKFLKKPAGPNAQKLLHTQFIKRQRYL